ncbi:hypothetical protein LH51_01230 [Nitrincola sp. A-D6]|uniref:sensor histidine kinase n=1 Tax=Nitrincola sp. A-D6 TaxID=1545442 RepID=UPI00051FB5CE|nr:ATP-binding protein [Nitrincola sp. A-D6]KGK43283.1 hypothetical protein LH51_01230 [Nitrincola sp. A-D6]
MRTCLTLRLPFIVLLALMVFFSARVEADMVILDQDTLTLDRGQLSIYEDTSARLLLDQIVELRQLGRFKPTSDSFSEGYSNSAFWGYTQVTRPQASSGIWGVSITPSYLDQVDIFIMQDGELIRHMQVGDQVADPEHDIHSRLHLAQAYFPVGTSDVYFRLKTTSTSLLLVKLIPEINLESYIDISIVFEGILIGVLLTILIINLINSIWLKSALFINFVLYEISLLVTVSLSIGLTRRLVPSLEMIEQNQIFKLSLIISAILALLFIYRLISFSFKRKWIVDLIFIVGILHTCYAFYMTLTGRFVEVMNYMNWIGALLPLSVSLIVLPDWRSFDTEKKYRVMGFVAFGLFACLNSMYVNGFIGSSGLKSFISPITILSFQLILHFVIMLSIRKSQTAVEEAKQAAELARYEAASERARRQDAQTFLAMLSHEIRTPLTVIDSAAQSLIRIHDQTEENNTTRLRYVRIRKSVKRISELLTMSVSKAQADIERLAGKQDTYDLIKLTWTVIDEFNKNERKRIMFCYTESAMPDHYLLPEKACHIVMRNLIDNALKYSPADAPVDVMVRKGAQGVCWSVRDSGPGLTEHVRNHMFKQFFRADERASVPGLGLGLYVVKQLTEQYNATLQVETLDDGTVFSCCLQTEQS